MVESEAKELSEEIMLGAVTFGHRDFQPVIDAIIELAETLAKEPWDLAGPHRPRPRSKPGCARRSGRTSMRPIASAASRSAATGSTPPRPMARPVRQRRRNRPSPSSVQGHRKGDRARRHPRDGTRIDGRDTKTVRPIDCQVGVLPRAHGSALFTRGETQALVVATLGTGQDEQIIDALEGEYREHFPAALQLPALLDWAKPGAWARPGRREIGHGKLAWRAVHPLLAVKESFPYTIRVVSEITEIERLVLDGHGVRLVAGADGCRACRWRGRSPASPWA